MPEPYGTGGNNLQMVSVKSSTFPTSVSSLLISYYPYFSPVVAAKEGELLSYPLQLLQLCPGPGPLLLNFLLRVAEKGIRGFYDGFQIIAQFFPLQLLLCRLPHIIKRTPGLVLNRLCLP